VIVSHMANRVAVASVIAAVGIVAVIGTIAAVTSTNKVDDNDAAGMYSSVDLSTVCASTLYPQKCEQSLKPVVNNTSDPEDVLKATLNVALDEVASTFQRSAHIGKGATDNLTRNAMDVCKKLLDDSTEDLRAMARLKPEDVVRHVKDLRVWVSGVMTYVYTCAAGGSQSSERHPGGCGARPPASWLADGRGRGGDQRRPRASVRR